MDNNPDKSKEEMNQNKEMAAESHPATSPSFTEEPAGRPDTRVETVLPAGFFSRLVSVLISPVKLFRNITHHPKILAPILWLLVLSIPSMMVMYFLVPMQAEQSYPALLTAYGQEFLDFYKNIIDSTRLLSAFTGGIGMIVVTIFSSAVQGLIIWVFSRILKSETSFKQYFSMLLHIGIVTLIGSLLATSIMVATYSSLNVFSLAAFLPVEEGTPVYGLCSALSIFFIWQSVLLFVGIKTVSGLKGGKAIVMALVPVLLFAGVSLAFSWGVSDMVAAAKPSYDMFMQRKNMNY